MNESWGQEKGKQQRDIAHEPKLSHLISLCKDCHPRAAAVTLNTPPLSSMASTRMAAWIGASFGKIEISALPTSHAAAGRTP